MCLICVEMTKNKLTSKEARSNLRETYKTLPKEHVYEVIKMIWKKEDEEAEEAEQLLEKEEHENH